MKIGNYIKSMIASINRKEAIEDLMFDIEQTEQYIPSLIKGLVNIKTFIKKTPSAVTDLVKRILPNLDDGGREMHAVLSKHNPTILENIKYLDSNLDKHLGRRILLDGLNVKGITVISILEMVHLYSNYTAAMLETLIKYHGAANTSSKRDIYKVNKPTIEYLNKYASSYADAINLLSMKSKDFSSLIDDALEVMVNEGNESAVRSTFPAVGATPVSMMRTGFVYNPIYHVRMSIAEYQAARYDRLEEKKGHLQSMLIYLEEESKNNNNPGLEKEIEQTQRRIETIDYKLKKISE